MGLREDAIAAAEAARQTRISQARAALGQVLDPGTVDDLSVAAELATQVVFTDGTMHLAVDAAGKVSLVRNNDGWTRIAAVTSLSELGYLLTLTGGA